MRLTLSGMPYAQIPALFPSLILLALLAASAACADDESGEDASTPTATPAFGLRTDVVTPADRVREIAFAPDGRIFFAEQVTGNIRIIQADGTVQGQPFATLAVADYLQLDWGLTGLALDPHFESNGYVYAFFTEPLNTQDQPLGPTGRPQIVRFTDENGIGVDRTLISNDFPETPIEHPGFNGNGKLAFGPDGFLYASIGDYDYNQDDPATFSQDLSRPIGKLLRIDPADGAAAPGNPFEGAGAADARVYAYGFRDPFPFTFHPETRRLYATDNTTLTCEELNVIRPGANYGWPAGEFPYADCEVGEQGAVIHNFARDGMQPIDFVSFVEVSSLVFSSGARYPSMGGGLIVCESWRSQSADGNLDPGVLRRIVLNDAGDEVVSSDAIVRDCRGAVAVAPDGTIYYANDTEIRKLEIGPPDTGGSQETADGEQPTQPVPIATP